VSVREPVRRRHRCRCRFRCRLQVQIQVQVQATAEGSLHLLHGLYLPRAPWDGIATCKLCGKRQPVCVRCLLHSVKVQPQIQFHSRVAHQGSRLKIIGIQTSGSGKNGAPAAPRPQAAGRSAASVRFCQLLAAVSASECRRPHTPHLSPHACMEVQESEGELT
jgi:hypothetical protein